jgi:hypothetical protein
VVPRDAWIGVRRDDLRVLGGGELDGELHGGAGRRSAVVADDVDL